MSNNASIPEVGKGATEMHYTDRTVYEVVEVSADLKTVKLEHLEVEARVKPSPMGHQDWIFKPTGQFFTVVWKWGSWKVKRKVIVFTDVRPKNVVPGITKEKYEYSTIKLLFGRKDYYYDWEF